MTPPQVYRVIQLSVGAVTLARLMSLYDVGPRALGREIGVSHPTVIAWLSGAKRPEKHNRRAVSRWARDRGHKLPPSAWNYLAAATTGKDRV
jgi:hypothetical protein